MMYLTGPSWMRSFTALEGRSEPLIYGVFHDAAGCPIGSYEERTDGAFTWSLPSGESGMEATEIGAQVATKKMLALEEARACLVKEGQ